MIVIKFDTFYEFLALILTIINLNVETFDNGMDPFSLFMLWQGIYVMVTVFDISGLGFAPGYFFAQDFIGYMFNHAYFTLATLDDVKSLGHFASEQYLLAQLEFLFLQFTCNW